MPGEARCKICDTQFKRVNNNSCYCSEECKEIGHEQNRARWREDADRRRRERQAARRRSCVHCGQEFKPSGASKLCGDECRRAWTNLRARLNAHKRLV